MKTTTLFKTLYSVVYDNGDVKMMEFTKQGLSGFKRSKKYKQVVTMRRVYSLTITLKTFD